MLVQAYRPARLAVDSNVMVIANAIVAGAIRSPVKIVCSPGTAGIIAVSAGVPCLACRTLDEAVFVAWPQNR